MVDVSVVVILLLSGMEWNAWGNSQKSFCYENYASVLLYNNVSCSTAAVLKEGSVVVCCVWGSTHTEENGGGGVF